MTAVFGGCGPPSDELEEIETATEPLLLNNQAQLWWPNGPNNTSPVNIPVCWQSPGWAYEKKQVVDALKRTWSRVAPIDFNFADCNLFSGAAVRVSIALGDGGSAGFGYGASVSFSFPVPSTNAVAERARIDRIRYLAVHEFGHILGFAHEQDSPERETNACSIDSNGNLQQPWPGVTQLGAWDQDSVMNYCNRYGNGVGYLTPRDIAGVRAVYGTRKVRNRGDFDGNQTADIAVYRPSTFQWFVRNQFTRFWGQPDDVTVSGDFNGDGKDEPAIWRPSTGFWFVDGGVIAKLGNPGDIPVPGDYNGDGKTDFATWKPATGIWSTNNGVTPPRQWGLTGDIPVPGDYDGDGLTDFAVWRPSTGTWHIFGTVYSYDMQWGQAGDVPVPGDYAGEGKVRPAIWRPGTGEWFFALAPINGSGANPQQWGQLGDIPVPASYSGNGITEIAVWRPAQGLWFFPTAAAQQWGQAGDVPLPRSAH